MALVGLVTASCGDDDDSDSSRSATATTSASSTTASTTEETATTGAAAADAFPVTIEHVYGDTTIETEPERVVTVGFAEHEGVLALGVTPVGVRDWYGDQPEATWPWAQDELGDAEPEVIPSAELDFEQIKRLDPDVILGVNSGMTDADYELLAAIAPTIPRPDGDDDFGTSWRESLEIAGRALGRSEEAQGVIDETEQRFADVRAEHPEFEGKTAAVAFTFEEEPGAYASTDARAQLLTEMGFETPSEFDELAGDDFYFTTSQEDIAMLDTDVLVWVVSTEADVEPIRTMALRPSLSVFGEGREVLADPVLSGAFSHGSPLSIEYVVDELVPQLALAVDGDPATVVPAAAAIDPEGTEPATSDTEPATSDTEPATSDTGEEAASDAWTKVFDSTVPFEDKAIHVAEADALRETIDAYETAGSSMGGISLQPTDVAIDGDTAMVTYDVLFGESTAYSALTGTITLVDGTWVVGRDEFCGFMASARNPCPA